METEETSASDASAILRKWWWVGAIAIVVVLAIWLFATKNGVTNTGKKKEAALNAQYNDNFNYLSDCTIKIKESAGVVKGQTDALDRVLTDAIKGRYEGDTGASGAAKGGGALVSAMVEAYPDLSNLSGGFDRVLTVISGCRTDYRDQQTKMQRMIADFEAWRTGSFITRTFGGGFPDGNLKARKGEAVLRGDEALDQMSTVVLVREASKAQETHEVEPEDPFGSTSTTGR